MGLYEDIYEPAEDSFFMEKIIKAYLQDKSNLDICEVGVGSGFVFSEIINSNPNNNYSATDINELAIKSTKKRIGNKAKLFLGSLLEPLDKRQDLIFFNTPYLPCEDGEKFKDLNLKDKAIYGGKNGYEVIFNFIEELNEKLNEEGFVFMLFSSLSKEEKIKEKLTLEGFVIENIFRQKHFMEELIIYKFRKSNLIKKINNFKIKNLKYLTSGKHSKIYEGKLNEKGDVIIKCENNSFIEKEFYFLNKLKHEIFVPKVFYQDKGLIIMEKCRGEIIKDYLESNSKENILVILQKIINICIKLDKLGFQKFELTNPYKHIFINKGEIKFIDFERTIYSESPKNTTQFLQYIRRNERQLKEKDIFVDKNKIFNSSKKYKKNIYEIKITDLITL